ncbi:unnamed protein product [Calicophoron daubneyi]|uniref:Lethal giant larvae homologue 2 domain-containing protein n=1 Tax=Calicophoron daubneyi TaxID=300641 RepID=A0AAV2TGB0_CALDB
MPQKFFEPLRKLPHQIQNLNLIQKLQGLTLGHSAEFFGSYLSSTYGCPEYPSALAFDTKLGLLAVGSLKGVIRVYGTPGVVYHVQCAGEPIVALDFLPEEGRLLSASTDGLLTLFELNTKDGIWSRCSQVKVPHTEEDQTTAIAVGYGIVYVGSRNGTLRQVAVKDGRMSLGEDALTSCTSAMVKESVSIEKRSEVGVDSPIVSLEVQPGGNLLLIAYAGGCVAVGIPQSIPEDSAQPHPPDTAVPPTAEGEPATPSTEEPPEVKPENPEAQDELTAKLAEGEAAVQPETAPPAAGEGAQTAPATPAKEQHGERRATLKLKALTRSLRGTETPKTEADTEPPLPVPPAPRISHLLLRDQRVHWSTWRLTAPDTLSTEVTVAYGDGAFQVWPITAAASDQPPEPMIVSKRDPPSTPYGPLPCGAIKKILVSPGVNGGVITAFSGGLPRPEFEDRHAVSVLQDQDHHVCFQFGSEVKDFFFVPLRSRTSDDASTAEAGTKPAPPMNAAALIVLTERELVAIDLIQPDWPTYPTPYLNCLNLSPVTAVTHITKVPSVLLCRLRSAAKSEETANEQWPVWGGENGNANVDLAYNEGSDVVVIGHANGCITLLAIGRGDSVHHLGTLRTAALFNQSDIQNGEKCATTLEVETWPPFRRVGHCALAHPLSLEQPDPRLAITQLAAYVHHDPNTALDSLTVVVGGAGGHVSIWTTGGTDDKLKTLALFEPDVSRIQVNLVDQEAFSGRYTWKGLSALQPFEGVTQLCAGPSLYPYTLIQLDPPAAITSVALEQSWNLLAIGSPHGFAVIDLLARSTVYVDFIFGKIAPQKSVRPVTAVQNAIVNRGKQFTANMRQSFRKLKSLRTSTTTPGKSHDEAAPEQQPAEQSAEGTMPATTSGEEKPAEPQASEPPPPETTTAPPEEPAAAPEKTEETQPAVESGSSKDPTAHAEATPEPTPLVPDETGPSLVRSLLFVDTFVESPIPSGGQQPATIPPRVPSLWVGTANGRALAHTLTWEGTAGPVTVRLLKELQLQHRASIIGMCAVDAVSHEPVLHSSKLRTSCESQPAVESDSKLPPEDEEKNEETSTSPEAATAEGTASAPAGDHPETAASTGPAPPQEAHQLIICSEEQVKLFSLPSLRALHKQKFVDRLRLNYGPVRATVSVTQKHEKEATEKPEAPVEPATESTSKQPASCQHLRKSLLSFGVQGFIRGTPDQPKTEWTVVVARRDGHASILSLPHLRKMFKVPGPVDPTSSFIPYVASLSTANIVLWSSGSQLYANELAPLPHLTSPASIVPGTTPQTMTTIVLPDWTRPNKPTPAEVEDKPVSETAVAPSTEVAPDTSKGEEAQVDVQAKTEAAVSDSAAVCAPTTADSSEVPEKPGVSATTASHAGDVTLDSIKEYLNGEGTVTIKTIETSSEKHTLVEGGHVVTTLRETEKVDGKVTKDDVIKFASDEDTACSAVTAAH